MTVIWFFCVSSGMGFQLIWHFEKALQGGYEVTPLQWLAQKGGADGNSIKMSKNKLKLFKPLFLTQFIDLNRRPTFSNNAFVLHSYKAWLTL